MVRLLHLSKCACAVILDGDVAARNFVLPISALTAVVCKDRVTRLAMSLFPFNRAVHAKVSYARSPRYAFMVRSNGFANVGCVRFIYGLFSASVAIGDRYDLTA